MGLHKVAAETCVPRQGSWSPRLCSKWCPFVPPGLRMPLGPSWCCLQASSSGRAVSALILLLGSCSLSQFYLPLIFMSNLPYLCSINFSTAEDSFLSAIINYTNSSTVHFKLSPTYVLYLACRYVLSNQYRPDASPAERTHKVIAIVNKMVSMMEGVIQVSACA